MEFNASIIARHDSTEIRREGGEYVRTSPRGRLRRYRAFATIMRTWLTAHPRSSVMAENLTAEESAEFAGL